VVVLNVKLRPCFLLNFTSDYLQSKVKDAHQILIEIQETDNEDAHDANDTESGSNGDPDPEDEEAAAEGDDDDDDDDDDDEEDEEDPEDPADALRESCTKSATCRPLSKSFDACEERVSSKSKTEETCLEEYLNFIKCRDKCVSRDLFSKLK